MRHRRRTASRSLRLMLFMVSLAIVAGPAIVQPEPVAAATQPNIVIFYLDDLNRHDGRLWNDPNRTPAIHRHFVSRGLNLINAIAENPLCCPSRANLLTGLHTHNNGVFTNNGRAFDPSVHIGRRLRQAGYASIYIGKYLNRAHAFTRAEWRAHASGWTYFDVLNEVNGRFYNYELYTKGGGRVWYGSEPSDHSTQMVGDRAVRRFRQVSSAQPIFAILSIYNTHTPNTPMPRFRGSTLCAGMPPWRPPSYNEADVSDKPEWVRRRPRLTRVDGWPMVRHCEEMLGVNWVVRAVTAELRAQGRLDNTLLIFTADNGMGWGEHRLPKKRSPYATRVPLYMAWPGRWGAERRVVRDHVSNIDFAPTFCALAGCQMGPYPNGQTSPDGINMLPLLDGDSATLGRDALLERGRANGGWIPWTALRTTAIHPAGLWHYVEYATGERELYDLRADPWELENRANQPDTGALQLALAQRLAELRQAGRR